MLISGDQHLRPDITGCRAVDLYQGRDGEARKPFAHLEQGRADIVYRGGKVPAGHAQIGFRERGERILIPHQTRRNRSSSSRGGCKVMVPLT